VGQTLAAQDLCSGLRPYMKSHHMQPGVGHYGVFSGRRWDNQSILSSATISSPAFEAARCRMDAEASLFRCGKPPQMLGFRFKHLGRPSAALLASAPVKLRRSDVNAAKMASRHSIELSD